MLFLFYFIFLFLSGSESVHSVYCLFISICVVVGDPIVKRGIVQTPIYGLTPQHFCACSMGRGFVDIGGIEYHHCLNILFIMDYNTCII